MTVRCPYCNGSGCGALNPARPCGACKGRALVATAALNGRPAWIGNREESYGGMRGNTADHVVTGGRALCGRRGPFLVRSLTARTAATADWCRTCAKIYLPAHERAISG